MLTAKMAHAVHHRVLLLVATALTLGVCGATSQWHAKHCTKTYSASNVALVMQDGVIVPVDQHDVNGACACLQPGHHTTHRRGRQRLVHRL